MWQQFIAFLMAIVAFFMQLFGISTPIAGVTVEKDYSYGSNSAQAMDIYLPENTTETGLMVYIHGGAWVEGDKSEGTSAAQSCAADYGLAAITINYRMLREGFDCDDIMEDVGLALGAAKDYAASKGVTITAAALGGASAGGHIALLYSYKYAAVSPIPLAFVFDQCGPADLTDKAFYTGNELGETFVYETVSDLAGIEVTPDNFYDEAVQAALREISPVNYVTSSSVPTLISHGLLDNIVKYSNSETLANALSAAGVKYDFVTFPNSGHVHSNDPEASDAYFALLLSYAQEYLL